MVFVSKNHPPPWLHLQTTRHIAPRADTKLWWTDFEVLQLASRLICCFHPNSDLFVLAPPRAGGWGAGGAFS
jgi:hypothetical protein